MATAGYNTTWQQVAGPSLSGLDQMGALIRGAVNSGVAAVEGWQKAQQENAAGQMIQESLKYTNPSDLEAAMARGDLTRGINPQYIAPSLMKDMQTRISDARGNEIQKANVSLGQQRIDLAKLEQERLVESLNGAKTNNQKMFEYQSLVDKGDLGALKQWIDSNTDWAAKNLGAAGAGLYEKGAGAINSKISDMIAGSVIQGYAQNPAEALSTVGTALANKTPEEQLALKASLKKQGLDITDPKVLQGANAAETLLSNATNVPAPATSVNKKLADTVLGNGVFGTPTKPVSESTFRELAPFQEQLIKTTKGNTKLGLPPDKGSSAISAYQFTKETIDYLAPKVFGSGWQDTVFNEANQEKLAKALFEERKRTGNLVPTWQGLGTTPELKAKYSNPAFVKNATWDQVKADILKTEAGGYSSSFGSDVSAPPSNATAQLAAAVQPTPAISTPISAVDIYSGLRVDKPFSDTIDIATQTGNEIRDQVGKGNYAGAVGAAIKGAVKGVPAVANDVIGRPISILATGLGNQTNEVIKGATGFDLTGPQSTTAPTVVSPTNNATPEAARSFADEQAAANHDTSRGLQALRNAKVNTAVGAYSQAEVQKYVEAQHQRTVPGDEEKTFDNNLAYINKNLPGSAKLTLADLQALYNEHAGKDEATRPDISVFSRMYIKARTNPGILGLVGAGGRSALSDKLFSRIGEGATMYDPNTLDSLIKGFEPATLEMRKEMSKVVKEQAADTAKSDGDLKALRDQIIDLEKTVAANKRFGLPNGATEISLAIARAAEIEATAKAKSKLDTAINLTK